MGKGDIKTRRGKFFAGSFGKRRPKKKKKPLSVVQPVEKPREIRPTTPSTAKKEPATGEAKNTSHATSKGSKVEEKQKVTKKEQAKTKENKENAE